MDIIVFVHLSVICRGVSYGSIAYPCFIGIGVVDVTVYNERIHLPLGNICVHSK